MTDITTKLKVLFGDRLKIDEPLAKHLNFRIGGPAKWFAEVKTVDELKKAYQIAKDNDVPIFVLGGGSNSLASDEGFAGLVLKIAMREIKVDETTVTAEAGVISSALARQTAKAGLKGFTWAVSLPGTIGGAVRGNAGCFGGETKDYLKSIEVFRDGEIVTLMRDDLKFGYRDSVIKHSDDIILSATFELEKGDSVELNADIEEMLAKRKATQPTNAGSAGCMFKNYEFSDESELVKLKADADIPVSMLENKKISVGWLIDQMGFKGEKIGDAMVSEEHANFLVNLGKATASDVMQLISMIKMAARDRYGIQLEEEVQYFG
ncbi:UDP-N-acetylmuramate dehydrogenase [Patescibacteria group bacterium]|nr:UDP-N-acetylmuramate dehydrogenase [Patescibacteria group bacterium]